MQLEGLILLLLMSIIIPVITLFANHNIFFLIIAIIFFAASIKNIHLALFRKTSYDDAAAKEEVDEDIEISSNMDIKKFGVGIRVVIGLISILFFVYCSFFTNSIYIKALISVIIVFWLSDIISNVKGYTLLETNKIFYRIKAAYLLLINIISILVVILVAYSKFIRRI